MSGDLGSGVVTLLMIIVTDAVHLALGRGGGGGIYTGPRRLSENQISGHRLLYFDFAQSYHRTSIAIATMPITKKTVLSEEAVAALPVFGE